MELDRFLDRWLQGRGLVVALGVAYKLTMRACIQRVSRAQVIVQGACVGAIDRGLLVLLGVGKADTSASAASLAKKIVQLRIFDDSQGKMNLSLLEVQGSLLAVSQFTLFADCSRGRRPSYIAAAPPELAEPLYQEFVSAVRAQGVRVETGVFRTEMTVQLVNEGPVTVWLDTDELSDT